MQNKYEVIGIVGEGAYGIVYKCKNKETGEFVAIKKFKETQDEIVKKTMAREFRVLQLLKNDYIVEFKGAFKRKENLFLVFEYVDKNLLELLQEHPKGLDPNLIKKIIFQLCKAINYLHDSNIVHRDIKPENLLVDSTNKLKLCDFGFARSLKTNKDNLTDYVATRWYRSPELLITSGVYGSEVDNWAIGCIMGELADGDPLFPGDNEVDQLIIIQKVIGRFADHQYEQFSKNPHFSGYKLPEIAKPETLERRYMGKLSKQAINFMKQLLHQDPKLRLKGENMFKHPYFENYLDPFGNDKATSNNVLTNNTNPISNRNQNPENNCNNQPNPNIVNKSISILTNRKEDQNPQQHQPHINYQQSNQPHTQGGHHNSQQKKHNSQSNNPHSHNLHSTNTNHNTGPIVANTTNINIINYNNYENKDISTKLEKFDKLEKMEKEKNKKFVQTLTNFGNSNYGGSNNIDLGMKGHKITSNKNSKNFGSQENLIMTSSGFNKNMKENILNLYGTTNYDKNFKTFYKGKYDYDIDMNFKKYNNKESKSKKLIEDKFRPNNIIMEEGYSGNYNHNNNSKVSPPKYNSNQNSNNSNNNHHYKAKNSFHQNNVQLPNIAGRTFMNVKKINYK